MLGESGRGGVRKAAKCGQNVGKKRRTPVLCSSNALDRRLPGTLPRRTSARPGPGPSQVDRTPRWEARARRPGARGPQVRCGNAVDPKLPVEAAMPILLHPATDQPLDMSGFTSHRRNHS